jgi:hypothetical protein
MCGAPRDSMMESRFQIGNNSALGCAQKHRVRRSVRNLVMAPRLQPIILRLAAQRNAGGSVRSSVRIDDGGSAPDTVATEIVPRSVVCGKKTQCESLSVTRYRWFVVGHAGGMILVAIGVLAWARAALA